MHIAETKLTDGTSFYLIQSRGRLQWYVDHPILGGSEPVDAADALVLAKIALLQSFETDKGFKGEIDNIIAKLTPAPKFAADLEDEA